jgi:hypothetical protein
VRIDGWGGTALQVTRVDPAGFSGYWRSESRSNGSRVTICDGGGGDGGFAKCARAVTPPNRQCSVFNNVRRRRSWRPSSDVVDPRSAQKIGRHPDDRHSDAANDVASSVAGHSTLDGIDAASPVAGIATPFAAAHESLLGTFRTWVVTLTMSVLEGKADGPVARPDFRI